MRTRNMTDNKREKILIILTFLVYGISYVSRYTYSSSVNAITSYYNITSAEFGLVGTCFFAMYGIGQFVNGILCKRYNKRIVMPASLMISAVLNFILFFQPDFRVYKYLWLINGASLSLLWSSLSETISKYVSKQNINKAIVALSASLAAGTAIVYSLSALFSELGIYQYVFLSATILCVLVSTIWFIMFPTIKNRDNPIEIGEVENEIINKETSKKSRSYFVIVIIFLGILAAVCNLLKDGLNTWVPKILKDSFNLTDSFSTLLTIVLPFFGIFSSILALFVNSKIKNYFTSTALYFGVSSVATGLILLSLNKNILALSLVMFGIVVLLMHTINSLITSVAPMEFRGKYSTGLISGVLNGCSYLGSTFSAYGLGLIADKAGWNGAIVTLLSCAVAATLIALSFAIVTHFKNKKTKLIKEE